MAEAVDPATSQSAVSMPQWICKNCGQWNDSPVQECVRCGSSRNYDPEASVAIDVDFVNRQVAERNTELHRKLRFYYELVKDAVLLIVAIYVLMISVRLYHTWPFQSVFERDAEQLADVVLALQGNLDLGVNKTHYDELLVQLQVQETKFKLKYEHRAEREREAYQKLVQSAEYYGIAKQAWDKELIAKRSSVSDPRAMSNETSDDVQRYWDTAASNALMALSDLR